MKLRLRSFQLLLLALCSVVVAPSSAIAKTAILPDRWVGTWAASPVAAPNTDGSIGGADRTYREIVHVSLGGPLVRIVFTNEFGTEPLTIGAAHIALSTKQASGGSSSSIGLTSANALTFSGSASITIPAGGLVVSDPAGLKLPPLSDLVVSFFVPAQTIHQVSAHSFADQTSYTAPGNVVSAASLSTPTTITSWPFLKGVDVLVSPESGAVVTFGDSITDGALSTQDANARWPDVLARRLHGNKKTANLGILNEGIGGNRVLHDGTGPNALARFDRDVIAQTGVKYVVLMESINDIGHATDPTSPYDVVTAQDLIGGLSQLAARAHVYGIKVIGATLTPFVGARYQSAAGETMRQAINDWMRTSKDFDGVIDFDKATRDPANPGMFLTTCDSGDHLHPGDAGYKVMGEAIDLGLFFEKK